MQVELKLSGADDAHIVKNLYPLYLHDISRFEELELNAHGVFGEEGLRTLGDLGERQREWWRNGEALFPYYVVADGKPVGINLISTHPYLPEDLEADWVVHGLFVLHPYRGRGVAEEAARLGFERHRGTWEVVTYPAHGRAIRFWERAIGEYTGGAFRQAEVDHPWGRKMQFLFDNSAP